LAGFGGQPPIEPPLLPTYRDSVIAYIKQQKLNQPILIGHSLGGFLAYWIAATTPKMVGLVISVDGLPFYSALDDPTATPQSAEESASRRRTMIQNAVGVRKAIQNRAYLASRITDRGDLQIVAAMSDQSDSATVGQAMYEMLTTDVRDQLGRIQVPVLLIGTNGSSVDDEERRIKEARYRQQVSGIADHTVVFHTHSRHFIQYDAPEFLAQQLSAFLQKHSSPELADSVIREDTAGESQ
jgi:pimeloyl-ACP methyl ester carboxylesterase